MGKLEKVIIGCAGGLAAVAVKFLGQDYDFLVQNIPNLAVEKQTSLIFGYVVLTPILVFLGALVSYVSEETKRIKLLAMAVAAPALITTWSGGVKVENIQSASSPFFSTAFAGEEPNNALEREDSGYQVFDENSVNEKKNTTEKIKEGIGLFFGYGKIEKRYWVIVGSYKDKTSARAFADKINNEDESLQAFVGIKVPPNEYYPVIVGAYSVLSTAKALKEKALKTDAISDAFLSVGAVR